MLNEYFAVSGKFNFLTAGKSYAETANIDERQRNVTTTKLLSCDTDWSCTFWT